MAIAELFTTLFQRLASPEVLSFARSEGIESQLKKWSKMLVKIGTVLPDAEHKQIHGTGEHNQLNLWLQDLKDLAYDVEDLLDEFAYDALAKINTSPDRGESENSTSPDRGESSKARRLVRCFGACNPSVVVSNASMRRKIKPITDRFRDIVKQQESLRLGDTTSGPGWSSDDRSTSCVADVSVIFGREKDKEAIIQMLLQGRDQAGLGVLPIISMGGLGKTTLAQLVYNDNIVQRDFPVRAWARVSDQFDVVRITRSILESLKIIPSGTDLNSLQVQLKEALSGKKFLLILDDVWNMDHSGWDSLCAPFSSGMSGSMVIVTTRIEGVASLVRGDFEPYCLIQNLTDIGVEIAKRCKGLPLAARMLGSILRNKDRPEQWLEVLQSGIWDLPEGGILPALKLSYHHLPPHLKECFAYCSLFPKDYEFDKQDLILLWMAEGFLQPRSNQKKQMHELGSDYFDDLTSRSFFQPSSTSSSKFVMYELVHDLARHVAPDAYLHVDNHNATSQDTTIRVRHSSFIRKNYDSFERFRLFGDMNSLRTFLALPMQNMPPQSLLSRKALADLLLKLTRVRVLSLCGYRIKELPDSIGQLKHLRYLNMAGAEIEKLPESVTSLFNLLTLILRHCENLEELPSSIGNLVNLQYLDLEDTPKLLRMPSGIKYLTKLRKLSKFVVGENEELGVYNLKELSGLRGKLWITGLHNVVDITGAVLANLSWKDGLEELRMEWRNEFDDSRDEDTEERVFYHLKPPASLRELEIFYYGGKELPWWLGCAFYFPLMARVRIEGCINVTSLPELGRLSSLKELTLCGLHRVTSVGDELYGHDNPHFVGKAFPSLETLSISDMLGWEEWSCSSGFRVLRALSLRNCPKLTGKLPSHLSSLEELQILDCPQLTGKLPTQLLHSVKKLQILDCPQLTTTPLATSLAPLREMYLDNCVTDQGSSQVHLSSLTKLRIANIPDLCSLSMLNSLPSLCDLKIERCSGLVSLGDTSLPSTLKRLRLYDCEALETLPLMHTECFLQELYIRGCNFLEHFPDVKEAKNSEAVPWRVKSLTILDNKKLSQDIMVHYIKSLRIQNCPSLVYFPARGKKLPSSLESLFIAHCENLQTLTEGMLMQDHNMPSSLEEIHISNCPSLTCFPTFGKLPTSLKLLSIVDCSKLSAIPETFPGSSLEEIEIHNCPNLQEFPESLIQHNVFTLKKVTVSGCVSLRSLPNQMNNLITLAYLSIENCPGLMWPGIPQGRSLTSLLNITSLKIGKTLFLEKDMSKWGLDRLTSLRSLHIDGVGMDDVVSFPEYDDGECFFLPTSITELAIVNFKYLEYLANELQELGSLRALKIFDCPELRYLSSEGLPSTLEVLSIVGSPIVGECCKKDGEYWPVVFHIPCVNIDNQVQ